MATSIISKIAAYGVCPETTAPQRYVGTDDPFRLSLELLHITLDNGVEGVASTCSGWRGAPVGRIVAEAETLADALVGQDVARVQQRLRPRQQPLLFKSGGMKLEDYRLPVFLRATSVVGTLQPVLELHPFKSLQWKSNHAPPHRIECPPEGPVGQGA